MRRGLLVGVLLSAGCAAARPPPGELVHAREAFARAQASPTAAFADGDLKEAKRELDAAEALAEQRPRDATVRDRAYVAWRKAERARIQGQYMADLQALAEGRRAVERMRRNVERRQADELLKQRQADEEARIDAVARVERDQAIEALANTCTQVVRAEGGPVVRYTCRNLFAAGRPRLMPYGAQLLDTAVRAFRRGPRARIIVWVPATEGARGTDAALLARRRAGLLRDELVARGVPYDMLEIAVVPPDVGTDPPSEAGWRPAGPNVDLAIVDQHQVEAAEAPMNSAGAASTEP